jgi:hypothetical protein
MHIEELHGAGVGRAETQRVKGATWGNQSNTRRSARERLLGEAVCAHRRAPTTGDRSALERCQVLTISLSILKVSL